MKEKTSMADKYLLKHFYETCSPDNKEAMNCSGVCLDENYSWLDIILDGEKKCCNCKYLVDEQGFYYGKGKFSENFKQQLYVRLMIKKQEEFEFVCNMMNPNVRGVCVRGAITDASPLSKFNNLEFVEFSDQRFDHFWDTTNNPELRIITIYGNNCLKSIDGLENAENLECIQFLTHTSSISTIKIESLKPLSKLKNLKEVILSGTEPIDHNIDYLIELPVLHYLWISPNVFPVECYAKFEAKRFMLSDEYGIYLEESGDIFPYGKGKRIMHTSQHKAKYMNEYMSLLESFKNN